MIPALLTAFFFALSATCGAWSVRYLGSRRANASRMTVAWILLALYAHGWGQGWGGGTLWWLMLSGVIGFGLGDWALFEALPRLGAGLTVLLCQCLAAPIAALTEWFWLGTSLTLGQLAACALILSGVAVAIRPSKTETPTQGRLGGFVLGVLAAMGQAWGAVLSRVANEHATQVIDGWSAAYQRMCGGMLFLVLFLLGRWFFLGADKIFESTAPNWKLGRRWMLANALAGPAFGVGCYQWALRTTPSGIVLPIVALTPLLVLPLTWFLEGQRPTLRALAGSMLSIAGVILLRWT